MLDMETGGMVGIDFGHAFGSATQVSSVKLVCVGADCAGKATQDTQYRTCDVSFISKDCSKLFIPSSI